MRDWVQNYSDASITLVGFFLFFAVFVGALVMVFSKKRKAFFEVMQMMPLDEAPAIPSLKGDQP